jgi:hypothetical protein
LLCLILALGAGCPSPRDDDDSAGADDDVTDDDDASDDDDDASDDDDTEPPDPCDEAVSRLTNIGCEFWAVDLDNAENFVDNAAGAQFAVAVANTSDTLTAEVEVRINEAAPGDPLSLTVVASASVPPGGLAVIDLPRRDVDGDNITTNTDDGPQTWLSSRAFRINSDAPIVAYQFNTIDQQFSNDASLLLPTHALGVTHYVLTNSPSGPFGDLGPLGDFGPRNRGYVTIVGVYAETEVDVTPTFDIVAGEGVPAVVTGGDGEDIGILAHTQETFRLGPFDVLNLETTLLVFDFFDPPLLLPDLTGTLVASDQPVAVFTGTDLSLFSDGWAAANDPDGDGPCCAEHIEEQVLPTRALRNTFVVSRSAVRSSTTPENDIYRIMAAGVAANVTTSLPGGDASFSLLPGEFRQMISQTGFIVEADNPVQVAQFLVAGGDVPSGTIGDSSMLIVPPVEQRLEEYTFTTGEGFSRNHVVVSLVDGTNAELDGVSLLSAGCAGPAAEGTLFGDDYVAWTCDIDDGVHQVTADAPIAIYVYGYYSAGSYAYPGGAALD